MDQDNTSPVLKLKASEVYDEIHASTERIIVNEGGARSTKTYSTIQEQITKSFRRTGAVSTFTRKSFPALRGSLMRDFTDIMKFYDLYRTQDHNKTENTYSFRGNLFEFIGLDQPQKRRGSKRTDLIMNEANEFSLEDFRQMSMRTSGQIYMDYNPSDIDSYIYDHVLTRPDVRLIRSTYLDNPFLEQSLIDEIEALKETDPYYWSVYGMGERARAENLIFHKWKVVDKFPDYFDYVIYGLDFGFNNPSALIFIGVRDQVRYLREDIYQNKLDTDQLIQAMRLVIPDPKIPIFGDPSEARAIQDIRRAGFNIAPANNAVTDGLNHCKGKQVRIHKSSSNLIKEFKYYKYLVLRDGTMTDHPVKFMDHGCDAWRYGDFTFTGRKGKGIIIPSVDAY